MAHSYRDTLRRRGLLSFLWTQFLGAFNDNLFKFVVTLVAAGVAVGADADRAVSIAGMVFVAPFLLFSGYAGQLADIYSKRTVLVVTKSLEIVATGLALIAFATGHLQLLFVTLFLISVQATFFSPAKYGILPELLPEGDLSRANGLLEMSTFVAIVAGAALGSLMFDAWRAELWLVGIVVLAIAIVGFGCSFGIPQVPAAAPQRHIGRNPWGDIVEGVKELAADRVLGLTVVGLSYFWFLGALLQSLMLLFATETLKLTGVWVGGITAMAAVGIGIGSIVAGRLSGDKVELGLAPIGAIGMGFSAIGLSLCSASAPAAVMLALAGFFGGFFAVPLNALLQQRAEANMKGRLQATNNFANMVGVALASAALWICGGIFHMTPGRIVLIFGVVTLISSVYVLALVPEFFIRFSLWLFTHTIYRITVVGEANVPRKGPALLICNHLSHLDGFFVGACLQRFVRFMIFKPYYDYWAFKPLMKKMKAIPISAGRSDMIAALDRARKELIDGHVVCIFAEGSISRTGNMLPFKRGFERISRDLDVPVVPVYLDRVWGSIFSFKGGRFFWKIPMRIPYPVTVVFGRPLPKNATAAQARLAMMELGADIAMQHRPANENLGRQFVRTAKRQWFSLCMADASKRTLSFGSALTASLLLSKAIRRRTEGQTHVGILVPASIGGALANVATTFSGKTAVNLNFTAGREAMAHAVDRCGIRTILTSRHFLAKASIEPTEGMVFLEDLMGQISSAAKLRTLVATFLLPAGLINRLYLQPAAVDPHAAVIFSSGSTGIPKGVILTHRNVLANVDSISQLFEVGPKDVLLGALPFFHSFGFTVTIWFPLLAGFGVAYHPNPMDAKVIGELAERHRATLLLATPTFCATYIRKCEKQQFAHLRHAIVGAEKLREPIANAFREKFGLSLLEGYGCTEMSPVVAINVPDVDDGGEHQVGVKPGSVGHPLPGVVAMIVDPETGEGPLFDREGLLLVKGPNRMLGYLGDEAKTRDALRDGWYVTGDIATIDSGGFIVITDRLARFSKIAGEMVPHMKIEDAINAVLAPDCASVVTGVPDASKGERLVAFYTDPGLRPADIWERLCQGELPRLWIPKREDIRFVEAIPSLGTGKTDLKGIKALAASHVASAAF
jgi:acyl-[acyl-carrier-protein]-phospholipid O-acyltransferase / long-chain-fatty-acid--[acyl-carrier-protein] ligase